jgi:hypothetical protein
LESALDWLETAAHEHAGPFIHLIKVDPYLDPCMVIPVSKRLFPKSYPVPWTNSHLEASVDEPEEILRRTETKILWRSSACSHFSLAKGQWNELGLTAVEAIGGGACWNPFSYLCGHPNQRANQGATAVGGQR